MDNDSSTTTRYLSYLVRLCRMPGCADKAAWRVAVETPVTREEHHFPDLEGLFRFLREQTQTDDGRQTTDDGQ